MTTLNSILAAVLLFPLASSMTQAQAAPAPVASTQQPAAVSSQTPTATVLPPAPVDPFPPADPKYFTAASPTVETVNSFLERTWGDDPDRRWRVMAIQPTTAPGVSQIIVAVTGRSSDAKPQAITFYVTPDGQHAIAAGSGVVPFAANPFAAARDLLKQSANGAARGAASKDLLLVEFSDLQCPHCKEAQATMDQIVKDFPDARVVFQLLPLTEIHPSAFKAAAYGVCAQKQSDAAFFNYADEVFKTQDALTPATDDTVLKAAAIRAGLDGSAIAACADTQATKDVVNADIKLANDAGVNQTTPTLSVNGRMLPVGIPYDSLKRLIVFQAKMDGVPTGASANILAPPPPPAPALTPLPK